LQLTTAGTITGGSWTNGSAVITFTSTTATLVRGMSLSAGITAGVIKSIDSATQITMSVAATASSTGTITVYNSTTTTLATSNTTVIDGKTLAVNDVVFLSQTALAQNGPWVVSALGTGVSLTRPTWFTGNLLAPMTFSVTAGTFLIGGTVSISLNSASPTLEIGIESLAIAVVSQRGNSNAVLGSNSFSGIQTFLANSSAGGAPFRFGGSGTGLNTTPIAHQVEWDGLLEYVTASMTFAGTWTTGSTTITLTTGTTSGLVVGAAIASGITGAAQLYVTAITGLTTFTVGANPTNAGTATAFTIANRDAVLTAAAFGTY
jgi:hypothetical protein